MLSEEAIKAIVWWWSAHLKDGPVGDEEAFNRLPKPEMLKSMRLMLLPSPEKIVRFEELFADLLRNPGEHLKGYGMWKYPEDFAIITDYGPQTPILSVAAKEAGVSAFAFPIKSCMSVKDNIVTVTNDTSRGWQIYPKKTAVKAEL